jgi:segregation and condensation protein B
MTESAGENRIADAMDAMKEDLLPAPEPTAAAAPAPQESELLRAFAEAMEAGGREPAGEATPRGPALPAGATLAGALEALLFIANEPLTLRELSDLLDRAPIPDLRRALAELRERYAREPRGFDLAEVAGGFRLLTRPEYASWVVRLETVRREERLSKAQLEALAVIAYRQPVLRADVDSVRGADSGGAIRGLAEKGLVKVVGRADALGRPLLYGTTDRFLERFGLKSIRDLPRPRPEAS